jgi:hypothetical protein
MTHPKQRRNRCELDISLARALVLPRAVGQVVSLQRVGKLLFAPISIRRAGCILPHIQVR